VSKPDGYLFDIPEPLLKGGMFIPLGNQVVLPGGAAMIRSTEHSSAKIFEELGVKNEFFTAVLAKDDAPDGEPGYHEIGTLSLIADHKPQRDGTWLTIIAGIGRVRLGQTYLVAESPFPRLDVEIVPTLCDDEAEARRRLHSFEKIATGLGSSHEDLVNALHRYAREDAEPSLSVDRLAGLVGVGRPALLQQFLNETDIFARLDMLDSQLLEYMARVKGRDARRKPGGDFD